LVEQISAKTVPTSDLKNVFVFYIQSELIEKRQFKILVSPPAPPGTHGTKFNVGKFHGENRIPIEETSRRRRPDWRSRVEGLKAYGTLCIDYAVYIRPIA
jgi:hypothetical protein